MRRTDVHKSALCFREKKLKDLSDEAGDVVDDASGCESAAACDETALLLSQANAEPLYFDICSRRVTSCWCTRREGKKQANKAEGSAKDAADKAESEGKG